MAWSRFGFSNAMGDSDRLEQFMTAMQGVPLGNFHALAEKFDFSRYETVCDVGGATALHGKYRRASARETGIAVSRVAHAALNAQPLLAWEARDSRGAIHGDALGRSACRRDPRADNYQ